MGSDDQAPIVQLKVILPARTEGLADLHAAFDLFFAQAEAEGPALAVEDRVALLTAAGEVAANIVEHACNHLPDAQMLLELYARNGGFEVAFTDSGTEFDTRDTGEEEDPAQADAEGGRGLAVVRASVDEVEYVRTAEDTNRWRLLRNRRP